jgi:hypothetical protein
MKIRLKALLLSAAGIIAGFHSSGQCCDYTIVMNDTYGDGWNGASLDIWVNGDFVNNVAAEESGSNFSFEVCNGDEILMDYESGEYENENTWYLLGGEGNLIDSDGPEPQVGETEVYIVDCDLQPDLGSGPCAPIAIEEYGCAPQDNSFASGSAISGPCANYQGGDLWFTVEVSESGNLIINTQSNGNLNDTGLAVWYGDDCLDLDLYDCDDDSWTGYFSMITVFGFEPGSTLYIQCWGWDGQIGSFDLCISDPGTVEIDSSNLPIFLIDTGGEVIPNEPKIDASLQVLYNGPGELNYMSDAPDEYDGVIGIEVRGAASAGYPQKPDSFETRDALGENNNVSLIDMPEENDWVLLSNYNDKTFIRNVLAQHLYELMGNYAPRSTLCEVILNDDYQGVYVFGEKIKRDGGRVDIATLGPDENEGDDVTGGYILELNYWNNNNSWELSYSPPDHPDYDIHLVYRYPKPDVISEPQKDYLVTFVDSMETALYSENFEDPQEGYRKYMDIESFIDYFLLNELSRNNDGFKKSRYFHKDKYSNGGKFKAGPPWDFDWAWKDMWSCEQFENTDGSGWAHLINDCATDNYSPGWYLRLLQDTSFNNHLRCRYDEYRDDFLNMEYIENYVDSVMNLVEEAQARHYQKWPFLGLVTGSPKVEPLPETYAGEMEFLKDWIALRLNWLDENLPQDCTGLPANLDEEMGAEVRLFPNPSSGQFFVESTSDISGIRVYSTDGRLVKEIASMGMFQEVILDDMGVYICEVFNESSTWVKRVVIK